MINRNKHSNPNSELYRAMLTLKTPEECHNFLCDLCTQSELNAIEQRYDVAKMLSLGKIYSEILAATNASSATVSRVNRTLANGTGAYDMVLQRMSGSDTEKD